MVTRKLSLLVVGLFVLACLPSVDSVSASSDNWVEVTRIEGNASPHTTRGIHFICDCPEWRIKCEINPTHLASHFPELLLRFNVTIYAEEDEMNYVDQINLDTLGRDGILMIHNHVGEFYMLIKASNLDSFTIIVEQNIDSIPEFPSWITLPILIIAIMIVIIIKKHGFRNYSGST